MDADAGDSARPASRSAHGRLTTGFAQCRTAIKWKASALVVIGECDVPRACRNARGTGRRRPVGGQQL